MVNVEEINRPTSSYEELELVLNQSIYPIDNPLIDYMASEFTAQPNSIALKISKIIPSDEALATINNIFNNLTFSSAILPRLEFINAHGWLVEDKVVHGRQRDPFKPISKVADLEPTCQSIRWLPVKRDNLAQVANLIAPTDANCYWICGKDILVNTSFQDSQNQHSNQEIKLVPVQYFNAKKFLYFGPNADIEKAKDKILAKPSYNQASFEDKEKRDEALIKIILKAAMANRDVISYVEYINSVPRQARTIVAIGIINKDKETVEAGINRVLELPIDHPRRTLAISNLAKQVVLFDPKLAESLARQLPSQKSKIKTFTGLSECVDGTLSEYFLDIAKAIAN